jgi:hypothetical protein
MSSLQEDLSSLRQDSRCKGRKFFFYPPHAVGKLLTSEAIRTSISSIPSLREGQLDLFTSLIQENNPRTFAILLINGDQVQILEFLYRRLTDDRIPYAEESLYFLPKAKARQFVQRQWEFIPVILAKGEIHRKIQDDEILPFLDDECSGKGGFGTVYKVKLCPPCQSLVLEEVENVSLAHSSASFN